MTLKNCTAKKKICSPNGTCLVPKGENVYMDSDWIETYNLQDLFEDA